MCVEVHTCDSSGLRIWRREPGMTIGCMVGAENDFSSGGDLNLSNAQTLQEMNPNHSYNQSFYGQSGSTFVPGTGGPGSHGYPGSMSPYGGTHGGPLSPYSQGQGQSPTGGQSMYANQNSQYTNQSQSSPYPGPPVPGATYPPPSFHSQPPMQNYYGNNSPTHSVQHHFPFGHLPLRHPSNPELGPRGPTAPHPMGLMMGARIPQPINSPNQNLSGNHIKTESMDLKAGGGHYSASPAQSQGYSQSGFGYNGYGGGGAGPGGVPTTRPILSPMSPHGRINISPGGAGGPNLSPRDGPPNMSPHSGHPGLGGGMYSGQLASPGNPAAAAQASGFPPQPGFNTGYDYFSKQNQQQMQPSPLSQGSSYGGLKDDGTPDHRGNGGFTADDKLSDVQSNASARSGGGGETPQHNTFSDDNNSAGGTNNSAVGTLVKVKKETISEHSGDTIKPGEETQSSKIPGEQDHPMIKSEKLEGFNYEDAPHKSYGSQALMDSMNLDSIPELPDIPELKYEDVSGMVDRRHLAKGMGGHIKAPLSPGEGEEGPLGPHHMGEYMDEHVKEEGYADNMSWHMQGMDGAYPPPHHIQYPNQQQMWANFYNSGGASTDDLNGGRYPGPMSPHMGMDGGWWQGAPHPGPPEMGPYRIGSPGMPPAPGPWAMRGPRPRGERRGPGRPRLTSKGERSRTRNPSTPGASPYYPGQEGLSPDMMGSPGEMKRGPGRPKALMDPNVPKVPGETTKNGNKKRYTCEVCQKRFSTAWYVRVHRRSHNGERPYVCNNCGKGFMLPNVLQVHLRKCEKNNPPSGGSVGGTGPLGPIALAIRAGDPPPNPPPSQTSSPNIAGAPNFGFPDPNSLPQSQSQQFPGMGAFNQRYMGGMTPPNMSGQNPYTPNLGSDIPLSQSQPYIADNPSQRYGLPDHPRLEDESPNQFSPIYSPSSNLPPSNETEHHFLANDKPRDKGGTGKCSPLHCSADQPNYCTTCDIRFDDKNVTEEHLKTHRPFSCDICEKRFSQKCNLVTHLRLHTGEKPYNCDFCDKRFTQKGNLDAHIKTHTKEKPFSCTLCPKRFAFRASLQTHLKNHQNGTLSLDVDEEDLETIKLHAKMQHMDRSEFEYHSEEFDSNPGTSPSISPPAEFGATVIQNRLSVCSNPAEPDISKLADSRQTLAMLQ